MVINSLKELEKLMILCRKRGVDSIKIDNIEFRLSDEPVKVQRQSLQDKALPGATDKTIDADTKIETPGDLTPEQLLFYSTQSMNEGEGS